MKNAIITGATKGIGRAVTEIFAQNGYNVAICARTASDLEAFKTELEEKYKVQVIANPVDMSDKAAVKAFAQEVTNQWQTIDVLVNNAGVFIPCELASEETEEAFEQMMDLNLYSTYYMTQKVLPTMIEQKRGHIFNICSIASFMAYGAYAVSKHAMLGFSRVLREEVKEKGIRVTALMPGATYTSSWEGAGIPPERMMKAEDVAQSLFSIYQLSDQTVVEEIILRPQLGDI